MDDKDFFGGMVVGMIVAIVMGVVFSYIFDPTESNYKRGQIDALTGNVKYELVIQPDSSKIWEKYVD